MHEGATLEGMLSAEAAGSPSAGAVGQSVLRMAEAAIALYERIASPTLGGSLGALAGSVNSDGDGQRGLDLIAETLFSSALRRAPVACYVSEETDTASVFNPDGLLAVAIDPLDGSSNIEVNAPLGSIFSIFPTVPAAVADPAAAFRQTGRAQLAAGFFLYGPQTSLVLSTGSGVNLFVLRRETSEFVLTGAGLTIPGGCSEYAINASNYRHWHEPVRHYIDDCVRGADGPHGHNFNMRWMAALVADSFRIFTRGGVFLYPADHRQGYEQGRLRLLYEANPIAFLAEQAGGGATDGVNPILDHQPRSLHQRIPLVMGSADKVDMVRRYHLELSSPNRESPLFSRRGLMRG